MKDGKQPQHPVDKTIEFVTFSEIVNWIENWAKAALLSWSHLLENDKTILKAKDCDSDNMDHDNIGAYESFSDFLGNPGMEHNLRWRRPLRRQDVLSVTAITNMDLIQIWPETA